MVVGESMKQYLADGDAAVAANPNALDRDLHGKSDGQRLTKLSKQVPEGLYRRQEKSKC